MQMGTSTLPPTEVRCSFALSIWLALTQVFSLTVTIGKTKCEVTLHACAKNTNQLKLNKPFIPSKKSAGSSEASCFYYGQLNHEIETPFCG
jgi:hypothetical protein